MCKFLYLILYIAEIMSRYIGGDGADELPRHPPIIPSDCESASPLKMRQHSKSLTIYQLFNKLGGLTPL